MDALVHARACECVRVHVPMWVRGNRAQWCVRAMCVHVHVRVLACAQ